MTVRWISILIVVIAGCSAPQSETQNLLTDVRGDLSAVKDHLQSARTSIDAGLVAVGETETNVEAAQESASKDAKQIKELQHDYDKLRNNAWVRFILFVRKWFYIGLALYIGVGLISGVLLGRGIAVGIAGMVLDALPFANAFRFVGGLFRKKAQA